MNRLLNRLCILIAVLTPGLVAAQTEDPGHNRAVILMYHRFGEAGVPATNIRIDQLDAHISALQDGGHTVVPLADVVSAIRGGQALPDKAVAITVDDAYRSFLTDGWPKFKAAGFPVTLFVATEGVDAGYRDLLSWDEIRALRDDGVTLGAHSHSHAHYPSLSINAVNADLSAMTSSFLRELGDAPELFAYPYGEAGTQDMEIIQAAGFAAAFGQHSGAAGPGGNMFYLPRFSLNEAFGDTDRFRLIAATLPLPVTGVSPVDPVLRDSSPAVGLIFADPPADLAAITCFGPRGDRMMASVSGSAVRLQSAQPFPSGRARLNCTMPAQGRALAGRWYWFGWQFIAGLESEGVAVDARYR
jgi:peptidoglycan/xylan/chitin deacetylase (PgdA/CDA1 family)